MPQTVTLPGTGEKVAVDKAGGADYQLMKLTNGEAGSTDDIGTEAHPLPIKDSGYKISDLDMAESPFYFGYVTSLGAWYILKLTDTQARYAKGTTGYSTAWGNRKTSVSYDYYDVVF